MIDLRILGKQLRLPFEHNLNIPWPVRFELVTHILRGHDVRFGGYGRDWWRPTFKCFSCVTLWEAEYDADAFSPAEHQPTDLADMDIGSIRHGDELWLRKWPDGPVRPFVVTKAEHTESNNTVTYEFTLQDKELHDGPFGAGWGFKAAEAEGTGEEVEAGDPAGAGSGPSPRRPAGAPPGGGQRTGVQIGELLPSHHPDALR